MVQLQLDKGIGLKTVNGKEIFLTYCLNLHRGETMEEVQQALFTHAPSVFSRTNTGGRPWAVGPWFNNRIAEIILEEGDLAGLRQRLESTGLFTVTLNGFPFGTFHGARIKERVYLPDWSSRRRVQYTLHLLNILSQLLRDEVQGSISTLPVGYAASCSSHTVRKGTENMAECAWHFHRCIEKTGRDIVLSIEPEPDCVVGDLDSFLKFYNDHLLRTGSRYLERTHGTSLSAAEEIIRRHVGICMDTVHAAVCNEDVTQVLERLEGEGIRIGKIQLGAALRANGPDFFQLTPFNDPVYLHQTRFYHGDWHKSYADLNDFLSDTGNLMEKGHAVVHYHMPFTWQGRGDLSACHSVTPEFLEKAVSMGVNCFELEIYTLSVLPVWDKTKKVDECSLICDIVSSELKWLMEQFAIIT